MKFKYIFLFIFCFEALFSIYLEYEPLINHKIRLLMLPQSLGYNKYTKTLHIYFPSKNVGLGNRLKKIVSYTRYYNPKTIVLHWPDCDWVPAKFSDLFIWQYPVKLKEINKITPIKRDFFEDTEPLYKYVSHWALLVAKTDFANTYPEPFSIDFKFHQIPSNLIDIYKPYFTALKPSQQVQKRLKEIKLPPNTVAVQVRNAPDWKEYFGAEESFQSFFDVMDTFSSDTYFYLSAMSKEVASYFYERYPNRIIELPNKDYHSMVDATADLFVLGSTTQTLCSLHSTFCEVAWWIGGAKSRITVIGSYKGWTRKLETVDIIDKIE